MSPCILLLVIAVLLGCKAEPVVTPPSENASTAIEIEPGLICWSAGVKGHMVFSGEQFYYCGPPSFETRTFLASVGPALPVSAVPGCSEARR